MTFWLPLATLTAYAPFAYACYSWPRLAVLAFFALIGYGRARIGWAGALGFGLLVWLFLASELSADWVISTFGLYGTANNGLVTIVGLWSLYAGLRASKESRELFSFGLSAGLAVTALWCLGQLYGPEWLFLPDSIKSTPERALGLLGSPVYLGAVLAFGIPLLAGRGLWPGVASGIVGLWACGTRGAYLGVGVGLAILFHLRYKNRIANMRFAVYTMYILLACFVFFKSQNKKQSDAGRLLVYEAAWEGIKERPAFGWGPECAHFVFQKYKDSRWEKVYGQSTQDHAHNSVIDAVATSGIFGGVLFLAVWIAGLYDIRRSPEAAAAFCGLAVFSMFNPVGLAAKVLLVSVGALWSDCDRPVRVPLVAFALALVCFAGAFRMIYLERIATVPAEYLSTMRGLAAFNLRAIMPQ